MSNLQLIEELCHLVEQMSGIILRLSTELEKSRALTDAEQDAVRAVRTQYSVILGADEWPDALADILDDI